MLSCVRRISGLAINTTQNPADQALNASELVLAVIVRGITVLGSHREQVIRYSIGAG